MTDSEPPDDSNPMGAFAEFLRSFGAGFASPFGGLMGPAGDAGPSWDHARSAAGALASGGRSEPNVDPLVRIGFEQLSRVAELQISSLTGLTVSKTGAGVTVVPVTRAQWSAATTDDYRPLFEQLAGSIGTMMSAQIGLIEDDDVEQLAAMMPPGLDIDIPALFASLSTFIGPMMMATMAGSVVGQLGSNSFGSFDLPIPRPESSEILVVGDAIDSFAADWSLPVDDLRLFCCLNEIAHSAVLGLPHVRVRINDLLGRHAEGFEADSAALQAQFGDMDGDDALSIESLQAKMADPTFMLNAIRSDHQREVLTFIDAVVACVEGYVDWVVDTIGSRLIGSYGMVSEAMRRRRVEADSATRFVEQLFGLELTQPTIDRGSAFIDGVIERRGTDALSHLWSNAESLPTPSELAAPGLWLARMGLGDDAPLPELDDDPEIPDYPDL